jgi:cobalt/nickel transport system permease protein
VLIGPWAGFLVIAIVLIIQAFLFADGGLTALGLNIVNMALIGAVGGYLVYRFLFHRFGFRSDRVSIAAGLAAFLSVPLAGFGFVPEFALGGTAESMSIGAILAAMVGTHLLSGVGEGSSHSLWLVPS